MDAKQLGNTPARVREEVLHTDKGRIVLAWPEGLSAADTNDALDWLALIARKIRRAAECQRTGDALAELAKEQA